MTPEERAEKIVHPGVDERLLDTNALKALGDFSHLPTQWLKRAIADAIREAVVEERKACAAICDGMYERFKDEDEMGEVSTEAVHLNMAARAIRARGESNAAREGDEVPCA